MTLRPKRDVIIEGRPWLLVDAWRSPGGLGLGYFVHRGSDPETSGAADRRTALPEDRALEDFDEREIEELWEGAVPLTDSERRFEDTDGNLWLAQASGPAWSGSAAADAVGFRLVCLTRDAGTVVVEGRRLSELEDGDLARLVEPPAP